MLKLSIAPKPSVYSKYAKLYTGEAFPNGIRMISSQSKLAFLRLDKYDLMWNTRLADINILSISKLIDITRQLDGVIHKIRNSTNKDF